MLGLRGALHVGTQQLPQPCRTYLKRHSMAVLVELLSVSYYTYAVTKNSG